MKNNKYIWGLLLIILGIGGLVGNLFDIHLLSWGTIWPIFVLGTGLCFELAYFTTRRNPGLLVPGGILTTIGMLFFFEEFTHWYFSGYTWPIYILAVAIGLFQLYYFGGKPVALLAVSLGLGGFSMLCLVISIFGNILSWMRHSPFIPIALIGLGVLLIGVQMGKDKKNK